MGFRFRKSFKIAPGVKINVSPSGFSTTVGGKGASYNVDFRGKKKKAPQGAEQVSTKGCLLFFGIPAALFLGFIIWILNIGGGRLPYSHPVIVKGEGVNVRQYANTESYSKVLGSVTTGDTLEFVGLDEKGWCRVMTRDPKSAFKDQAFVYIQRKYLVIPDSTLAVAKKKGDLY